MKVRLQLMVQDPRAAEADGTRPLYGWNYDGEEVYLDGPVSRRVAVLDFDPVTGGLAAGARFRRPPPGRVLGGYEIADPDAVYARDVNQVTVFATVLKTIDMFEEADTLGRRITWAFDGPQLLVVPRAGEWANAYYERDSRSLQFFYFPSPLQPGRTIYTSLSHDIVAHETAHAILDGIAPDLYHAIAPQSLALHEAIADLTALLMAFRAGRLRKRALRATGGSIREATAFSWIAEEFGAALGVGERKEYLRNLDNDFMLVANGDRPVARNEPHDLSQVLTGALYRVMIRMHEADKRLIAERDGVTEFSASGKALFQAGERFKRLILRALDYLPPGEVSFADYGRAIIAADQASHPDDPQEREWLCEEFIDRGIVPSKAALQVETNFDHPALAGMDLETIVRSDWAAYDFANRHRELLRIPAGVPFRVRPRLDVTKLYYRGEGRTEAIRECLFKVSWDRREPNPAGARLPAERQITVGTTLAIDWAMRLIRARLCSDHADDGEDEHAEQRRDRDALLVQLLETGRLGVGRHAIGPGGRPLQSVVRAEVQENLMRVRGAARLLHIAGGDQ